MHVSTVAPIYQISVVALTEVDVVTLRSHVTHLMCLHMHRCRLQSCKSPRGHSRAQEGSEAREAGRWIHERK